jgi:glutathione S-transferase
MKRKVRATMTECFELIDRKLLKGPWVMGEQYTICDPYLFTIGTWIEGGGSTRPSCRASWSTANECWRARRCKKPWSPKGPKSPKLGASSTVFAPKSWRLSRPKGGTAATSI